MTLTEEVKTEARRLGFQLVGVTTPDPPAHLDFYDGWLSAGYHGQMAYLANERARQRRADPLKVLPECRSVLVLGVRYPQPLGRSASASPESGRVASFAWGDDYHDLLPDRLRALVSFIEATVGHPIPNRWYTDTGPILERELAQRAGLGWIGKNTCLINPQMGSYFLLAEIFLGTPLDPDPPYRFDRCGSCTRCLDACPTGCILPGRTLDARKCISYLTIELKGLIPEELRTQVGDWVFGCDICQQVCPWNKRFSMPVDDPAFNPREGLPAPYLADELALTPEAFNRKFKGSPLKRTKRRGYLRNVAVALGNTGDGPSLPALVQALGDPEPLVRGHAAWAVGQIGGESALRALREALSQEMDSYVSSEIRAALLKIG
jgi:epoxyqueuosine reductase